MSRFWTWLDVITRFCIAVTSIGSAVTGWTLLKDSIFKEAFIIFSAIAAVFTLIGSVFDIRSKLKDWGGGYNSFRDLRHEFQTLRSFIKIKKEKDQTEYTSNPFFRKKSSTAG
ncbi:hypothetical protein [Leptospira interrogans]|uniref:hypothetical protein n=1 Tax=Leptospira interrogans TaxID=173 RepID=UPI0002BBDE10|nr:hypothetical protein [Leptospira interrogans]AKP28248.1 hypothetical protein LIMLP_19550 [Leptospira interrogans serovar Manilae]AKP32030.1 hypothetical protein LIMHP_19555 [Leptospira interrogans serovar Manilae]EYU64921.1 hypothetical protein CI00_00140 [Leptospira interrogans serovar Manilae]MCR8649986.1 hypothetical protein [Leptospira interrogans serovar Bataviae]OAM86737.1 hypothetical protein A1343_12925 [Leptospira interrogans serovar Bataviae]